MMFVVPGKAQTAGSKRAFVRGGRAQVVDANPNAGAWKERVAIVAAQAMNGAALLEGPLHLEVVVQRTRPASHKTPKGILRKGAPLYPGGQDLTKLVRAIEDGCNGVVWRDDSQIVSQRNVKKFGPVDEAVVRVSGVALTQ